MPRHVIRRHRLLWEVFMLNFVQGVTTNATTQKVANSTLGLYHQELSEDLVCLTKVGRYCRRRTRLRIDCWYLLITYGPPFVLTLQRDLSGQLSYFSLVHILLSIYLHRHKPALLDVSFDV